MPPDIGLGWGDTVPEDVSGNELKVLPLTEGGLRTGLETSASCVVDAGPHRYGKPAVKHLDGENRVVREVDVESASVRLGDVRH